MMTLRFKNQKREDHDDEGHHDVDEILPFKSRQVDIALLSFYKGRFGCQPRPENHPMRYWAIAGWGPVPAALRAPEGIYRELELRHPSVLDQEIPWADGPFWVEERLQQNIIFSAGWTSVILVGEVRWVAMIDVRDDTTAENLRTPPQGCDAIVCSPQELKTYLPPIDTPTGREYIQMTSGEILVRNLRRGRNCVVARGGNAAVGKWFWELHHRRWRKHLPQLVVWHESVDDTDEYKTPCEEPNDSHSDFPCDPSENPFESELVVKTRNEALAVTETFLWTADAEPQLKHAMVQFMSNDPNGLWWKRGELPDGFLLSSFVQTRWGLFVGEFRSEKLCFVKSNWTLLDAMGSVLASTIMGGCAVRIPWKEELVSIQFKPSHATGKIVAMRALFY